MNNLPELYEKFVPARAVMTADHLIELKQKNQTDIWVVIDEIISTFKKRKPKEYDSYIMEVQEIRDTRADKFASNKKASLRYTVDCPEFVVKALRFLYDPAELDMNKAFWAEFWRRYPIFRVSERL